ncbi:MAG: YggS family pyridoxal phosphate-dependent enzyme [Alphaproteobacteria bacterium]|nr:YggS family pyridoxal phosphate-dependent enzyme [Alphaproteobacteria bacterium]
MTIEAALADIGGRIARACAGAGRNPNEVCLIAVSKTVADARLDAALAAGQIDFGENRVQEAAGKWPQRRAAHPSLRLHLIGPLQTNKAKDALGLFDAIHSLDRPRLAETLARLVPDLPRPPELFVQVNTGEEPQKSGILPRDADAFIARCRDQWKLPVTGLMCIPPAERIPAPHFALLGQIARRHGLAKLSMGMSADFEQAVMLGATHIRIGSAIFGARDTATNAQG